MLGAVWKIVAILPKGYSLVANFTRSIRHLADGELEQQRKNLEALRALIVASSVSAQAATRGSPNHPDAAKDQEQAVRAATEVGQSFAILFPSTDVAPQPYSLVAARHRYREVVGDESNLDIIDPHERGLRCADIEAACADLCCEIERAAFKQLGIGLGRKSGRVKGRHIPE
jgi:hypothetical protein